MRKPEYFVRVQRAAANDWKAWRDPRLGGAVIQLFKQVQSPKHVISELLQNADDSGAKWASAQLAGSEFTFSHNGEDFVEDQFASLCRFAYSNKRTIHTIGFRGIGFKSTFSLGARVEVRTPTLAVGFRKSSFTLPEWVEGSAAAEFTNITVPLVDPTIQADLIANFEQWGREPFPLLFLRNVRSLRLSETVIDWESLPQVAPMGGTWYSTPSLAARFLLCRSEPRPFPPESVAEIGQERGLDQEEVGQLPPCSIELVVGAPGRLYVVLPTGVELSMGFAVNAPFIQDPGRFGIKPPSTSPTNRWLLERAGQFAAEMMLAWLSDQSLTMLERAKAYQLLPSKPVAGASIAQECESIIASAFWSYVTEKPFILARDGTVVRTEHAVLLPIALADVWDDGEYARVAGFEGFHIVAGEVAAAHRTRLRDHADVKSCVISDITKRLSDVEPRRPKSLDQVERLWRAIADSFQKVWHPEWLCIVPALNGQTLRPASALCRVPERPKAVNKEDWTFLLSGVEQVCPMWAARVVPIPQSNGGGEGEDEQSAEIRAIWEELKFGTATSLSVILSRACEQYAEQKIEKHDWIRLASIHAVLDQKASDSLRYVKQNGEVVKVGGVDSKPLYDGDGLLETLFPKQHLASLVLADEYASPDRVDSIVWQKWLGSPLSGVDTWLRPFMRQAKYGARSRFEQALPYGLGNSAKYHYASDREYTYQHYWFNEYLLPVIDGMQECDVLELLRWNARSLTRIDSKEWMPYVDVLGYQTPTGGGNGRRIQFSGETTSAWIRQLRESPCLPDTNGRFRLPRELYVRSEKTRGLEGIEPFVAEEFDTTVARDFLLHVGVRDSPPNLDSLVKRLQALSSLKAPPREELSRLYARIDQLLPHIAWDNSQFASGKERFIELFAKVPLIFSQEHGWRRSDEVFITNSSLDLPEVPTVLADLSALQVWRQLGLRVEPDWSDLLVWVESLPHKFKLAEGDLRRLRKCIGREPDVIWAKGRWLSVAGEWVDHTSLSYELSAFSYAPRDLIPSIQRVTADFTEARPKIASLQALEGAVCEQIEAVTSNTELIPLPVWLNVVASRLTRIRLDDCDVQSGVRRYAESLTQTSWVTCSEIVSLPCLNGTPILVSNRTIPIHFDVDSQVMYVKRMDEAAEADELARYFSRLFRVDALEKAISFCYQRPEEQICRCLERAFNFDSAEHASQFREVASPDEVSHQAEDLGSYIELPQIGTDIAVHVDHRPAATKPFRVPTTVRQHKRNIPSGLIEDYAECAGFEPGDGNTFWKDNGEQIVRVESRDFPWEHRVDGQTIRRLLPIQATLRSPKLELDYEQWETLRQKPGMHALLLLADDHSPQLVEGQWLVEAVAQNQFAIRVASYRLTIVDS